MIHFEKFCPFERILTLFWRYSTERDVDAMELSIPGFPLFIQPITESYRNLKEAALGATESDRRRFFVERPPLATVVLKRGAERATKEIRLFHDLLTPAREDPDDETKKRERTVFVNGDMLATGSVNLYPEAYWSLLEGSASVDHEQALATDTYRTFFNFLLTAQDGDTFDIHCPALVYHNTARYFATIHTYGGRSLEVYRMVDAAPVIARDKTVDGNGETAVTADYSLPVFDNCVPHIRVTKDDQEFLIPVLPGLLKRDILGARVTPSEFLNILRLVVHDELFNGKQSARERTVDCSIASGHIWLAAHERELLEQNVATNPMVQKMLDTCVVTTDTLLTELKPGTSVPIYGDQVFALAGALTAAFAAVTGFCVGRMDAFIRALCESDFMAFDWAKRTYAFSRAARAGVEVIVGMDSARFTYIDKPGSCDDPYFVALVRASRGVTTPVLIRQDPAGSGVVVFDPMDVLTGQELNASLVEAIITVETLVARADDK